MNDNLSITFIIIQIIILFFLLILIYRSRKDYKTSYLQLYKLILKDKNDKDLKKRNK